MQLPLLEPDQENPTENQHSPLRRAIYAPPPVEYLSTNVCTTFLALIVKKCHKLFALIFPLVYPDCFHVLLVRWYVQRKGREGG